MKLRDAGRYGRALAGRRWSRVVVVLALALLSLTAFIPGSGRAAPPGDVGPERVYFPQTGHNLAYGFLDYWHHNGDIRVFGYPLTEEMKDPSTGLTVQYFEHAVFEWHPDAAPGWRVQLRRLGAEQSAARTSELPFKWGEGEFPAEVDLVLNPSVHTWPPAGEPACAASHEALRSVTSRDEITVDRAGAHGPVFDLDRLALARQMREGDIW